MPCPKTSTTERIDHETLVPLTSYPDSQGKDWLSAEARDQVARGLSYDEKAELPAILHHVHQDGQDQQDSGPGEGRSLPSSNLSRVYHGGVDGE
eukprot:8019799-Pyramimonas_sp.AAC.1